MTLFTGRLTLTVELDLEDADADLIEANIRAMVEDRVAFLDVMRSEVRAERYS